MKFYKVGSTIPNLLSGELANTYSAYPAPSIIKYHNSSYGGAVAVGASVHGASLHGTSVHGASVHSASLHGASLHGASVHGASVHGSGAQQQQGAGSALHSSGSSPSPVNTWTAHSIGPVTGQILSCSDSRFKILLFSYYLEII